MAKYLIERKSDDESDKFSILFKQGCHQNRCKPTCADLSAEDPAVSRENFNLSCSCPYNFGTFLPQEGKCLSNNQTAKNLKGAFGVVCNALHSKSKCSHILIGSC